MTSRTSRRALLAALALAACTNPPELTPTGDELVVRLEVSGDGELLSLATERFPEGTARRGRPTEHGELLLEVLAGDEVTWSGHRYVPYFRISEDFSGPDAIRGAAEPIDSTIHFLAFPYDGRAEVPLRISIVGPDGTSRVFDELVQVDDTGSAASPLIVNDDVAGRAEGLCARVLGADSCGEDQFCSGVIGDCQDEACVPEAPWDGGEVELVAGDGVRVLFVPLGWTDPDAFEQYMTDVVTQMHDNVDWYRENEGQVGFTLLRTACSYQATAPNSDDRDAVLDWVANLEDHSRRLPPADKIVAVGAGGTCSGVAYIGGRYGALTECGSASDMAYVLAHELGHAIGHLRDEYQYAAADTANCDDGTFQVAGPNLAPFADPSWFCAASDGQVYAGRDCGGASGGVVGAFVEPASACSNDVARPCENSMMRWHIDNQFDPVGEAAMSWAVEHGGDRLGFEDCDAGCDDSCTEYTLGTCGLNGCFQVCNACDGGDRCAGAQEIGYMCRATCPAGAATCRSTFGFDFCDGETALTTDGGCAGYRLARCDGGALVPMGCVM